MMMMMMVVVMHAATADSVILPWPWPWLNPHPSRCVGSHSDAILICFELPPLLPPQVIPILNKSLLTVLLQFVRGRPGPLPRNLPVQRLSRYALVIHSYHMFKQAKSSFTEYMNCVWSVRMETRCWLTVTKIQLKPALHYCIASVRYLATFHQSLLTYFLSIYTKPIFFLLRYWRTPGWSVAVPTTRCQTSLSLAFLQAV